MPLSCITAEATWRHDGESAFAFLLSSSLDAISMYFETKGGKLYLHVYTCSCEQKIELARRDGVIDTKSIEKQRTGDRFIAAENGTDVYLSGRRVAAPPVTR